MELLKDMLMKRHLYDLLKTAGNLPLKAPKGVSDEEWEIALAFGRLPERREGVLRIDSYLNPPPVSAYDLLEDPDDQKDPELLKAIRAERKREKRYRNSLRSADRARGLIAEEIADYLLKEEVLSGYLSDAGDKTIAILKDVSERELKGEVREVYSLDLPWKDCPAADSLVTWGYANVEELKPVMSKDQHRYVTGISIPGEVLALFRKLYTPEADFRRRKRNLVKNCCDLARAYYETAPLDLVLEICRRYAQGDPEAPVITREELLETALATQGDYYQVLEYEGEIYIVERAVKDDLELSENGEDCCFYYDVGRIRKNGNAFYIPSSEEILDYCRHRYWSRRKAWQEAWDWFTLFYLDEQYIQSIFPSMLAGCLGKSMESMDMDFYSMDDVEESTEEKMLQIIWPLMDDYEVMEILEDMKEVTLAVTEEAKANLIRIMEECRAQTNKRCYMGHMSREAMEARIRELREKA